MRKYRKKFIFEKLIYSNLMIIIFTITAVLLARGIWNLYKKYDFTKQEYTYIESQKLEAEKNLLLNQDKLDSLKTTDGVDKYLKETYPVKKTGENMIVIYQPVDPTYQIPKGKSTWQAFKDYIRKLFDF